MQFRKEKILSAKASGATVVWRQVTGVEIVRTQENATLLVVQISSTADIYTMHRSFYQRPRVPASARATEITSAAQAHATNGTQDKISGLKFLF